LRDNAAAAARETLADLYADAEAEAASGLFAGMLARLQQRLSLFIFRGFFEPVWALRLDDRLLTLAAPSPFHRDWLRDHYGDLLAEAATEIAGQPMRVTVVHDERLTDSRPPAEPVPGPQPTGIEAGQPQGSAPPRSAPILAFKGKDKAQPKGTLNPRYTFSSFITGHSNRVAFAACEAVAEHPASKYSPLFLFGGTGLGKTHLLHAIGNELLRGYPSLRIVYMSAEEWVNEYIKEIRQQRFDEFRARYRGGCDILLLDDIQFLSGKDASQDEFFHTFNSLYAAGRQIVVTSDRYPHEIEGLEERLKTRLQWGLIADVQPPDLETRVAILEQKAEALGIALPEDLAQFLASHIQKSVRELEGALHRLQAFATITGEPITLDRAREQLRNMVGPKSGPLTFETIIRAAGAYYDVKPVDLKSKSRQRQITLARQVAMYLARKHLGASLPEIGRAFGGRDHTTVLSSVRKITALLATDAGMQAVITRLERVLGSGPP
jgi:chromosomal replication initiator protein